MNDSQQRTREGVVKHWFREILIGLHTRIKGGKYWRLFFSLSQCGKMILSFHTKFCIKISSYNLKWHLFYDRRPFITKWPFKTGIPTVYGYFLFAAKILGKKMALPSWQRKCDNKGLLTLLSHIPTLKNYEKNKNQDIRNAA